MSLFDDVKNLSEKYEDEHSAQYEIDKSAEERLVRIKKMSDFIERHMKKKIADVGGRSFLIGEQWLHDDEENITKESLDSYDWNPISVRLIEWDTPSKEYNSTRETYAFDEFLEVCKELKKEGFVLTRNNNYVSSSCGFSKLYVKW